MAGGVLNEPRTLPRVRFELHLNELFDGFWASVRGVISRIYIEFIIQACLVDGQGSDWRPFIHAHDLSTFSRYGVRLVRLLGGRIGCYLQALCIALSCLLLVCLDGYNLPTQGREFHFQMWHGDYGSKLIKCLLANQRKI